MQLFFFKSLITKINRVCKFQTVFDLLKNPKITNSTKRVLEFTLATLVSRGCERNLCVTTGVLDKYINYFENKLAGRMSKLTTDKLIT